MPLNSQIEESIPITGLTDNVIGRKTELSGVVYMLFLKNESFAFPKKGSFAGLLMHL